MERKLNFYQQKNKENYEYAEEKHCTQDMKMYHNEEEMTLDDNEYKYDDIIYE